jgi:HEAT repeat protein
MAHLKCSLAVLLMCALCFCDLLAGSIGGTVFEDPNRNGLRDPDEEPIEGLQIVLLGGEGKILRTTFTNASGRYLFAALPDGQYVISMLPQKRLRASLPNRGADPPPIPNFPFGRPRYSNMANLVQNLIDAAIAGHDFRHVALGDSIAFGFNLCGSLFGENGYIEPTTDRLRQATAGGVITDKQAIPGHETADLLIPGLGPDDYLHFNDVFYAIDQAAPLVSISIGGNDLLGAEDGGDPDIVAALLIMRRNLQEILSGLTTGLPASDIELNTIYDNLQGTDPQHNVWTPIVNQVLRELVWGQERRASVGEIYPEYAHEENSRILGQTGLICEASGYDGIHPTNEGYDVHEEKLWQSFAGVTLNGNDRLDLDMGFLRRRRRPVASAYQDITGNTSNPKAALSIDGIGALIPSSNAEFRLQGFIPRVHTPARSSQSLLAGELAQAVLKIRYRTVGAPVDDYYVFEASVDGAFRHPGSTPSTWNTKIPLVGSSGNNGAERLVFPDQPEYRVVAAPLYLGAPTDGAPTLTWEDLKTLSVRVITHAVGAPDPYQVEWDGAWVEAYTMAPRQSMTGDRSWQELALADRHAALRRTMAHDPTKALELIRSFLAAGGPCDSEMIEALGEAGTPEDADLLRSALASADGMTRAHALRSTVRLLGAEAERDCLRAALDRDPAVRLTAARALCQLAAAAQADLFPRLAADVDPIVRCAALKSVRDQAAVSEHQLLQLLADPNDRVRVQAASLLLEQGSPAAVSVLVPALANPATRAAARSVLLGAADAMQRELLEALGLSAAKEQLATILGQCRQPSPELMAALRALLASPQSTLQIAAAEALSRLGDQDSLPSICALGERADLAASIAIDLSCFNDARAYAALLAIATSSSMPATARSVAARGLAASPDPGVIPFLQSARSALDARVRRLAESGLRLARE